MTNIDQYTIETTFSTRLAENIIMESIKGQIPEDMKLKISNVIKDLNNHKHIDNEEIFISVFALMLRDHVNQPVQSIATPIGKFAGYADDALKAFEWGFAFLKECRDSDLYKLNMKNNKCYVFPNFQTEHTVRNKLLKLQYLPPMKARPLKWTDNYNGGWLWENKHIVLGHRFNRHDNYLAYDAINRLQRIPWEIDPDTYLFEEQTNTTINKKQFLRVIDQYLGHHFYFVWRYDSRGRSYSSGYDLNLQSNEYGKALLSLHKKEKITKLSNLYIAIANHAGKDKLTWQGRINWYTKFATHVLVNQIKWKEPILARKALRALKDTKAGKPTGYVMSIDATSSGIQIMAILSGCKQTGKLVNCVSPNKRYDLYNKVAQMMNKKLSKPVSRKIVKECTMTHYYNSKATPKSLLSEKEQKVFYKIIEGLLPGAERVMDTINQCWNPVGDHHSWVMPDNHVVYVPVIERASKVHLDPEFGEIPLQWYYQTNSNNYRSLCPNVIHSIDGYIAREMIRRCKFQLSHIHDCFVFNPNHLQKVTETYRKIMAKIANSDLLADILSQIIKRPIIFSKDSNDLSKYILKSSYMLS